MQCTDDDDTQPNTIIPETPYFRAPIISSSPADSMLNLRVHATAAQHQAKVHNSNIVHGELATMYPHLERYFDGDDGDALARIHWDKCNAVDLWHVLTSKHLACGKTTSMAFSFRECLKKLKDIVVSLNLKAKFEDGLKDCNDKHTPSLASLRNDFIVALSTPSALVTIQAHMNKYHATKKIKIKDGLFPKFTDVQTNKVRIAAFMVSACTQELLHAMQNPCQSKASIAEKSERVAGGEPSFSLLLH